MLVHPGACRPVTRLLCATMVSLPQRAMFLAVLSRSSRWWIDGALPAQNRRILADAITFSGGVVGDPAGAVHFDGSTTIRPSGLRRRTWRNGGRLSAPSGAHSAWFVYHIEADGQTRPRRAAGEYLYYSLVES